METLYGYSEVQRDDFPDKVLFHPKNVNYSRSTLVISNSKGLTETLWDIRTSTYQSWESEENNKLNNHI